MKAVYPQRLVIYDDLARYSKSGTYRRHMKLIRKYLGFTGSEIDVRNQAKIFAFQAAKTKIRFLDVLNSVIEALVCAHYELPALSTLERIARQAVANAQKDVFSLIFEQITPELQLKIDTLLTSEGAAQQSRWQKLKETGDIPHKKVFKEYLISFDILRDLETLLPSLVSITQERKQQLVSEALSMDSWNMRRLPTTKRCVLAVILIDHRWTQGLDQLASLLIKVVREVVK